jgi:RNA polymerase sigma-54 factor
MREKLEQLLSVSRGLVPSPSLQYSLKILAMNNLELQELVDEECLKNPFLIKKENFCGGCSFIEEIPSGYNLQEEFFRELSFLRPSDFEKEIAATLINNVDGNYLNGESLKRVLGEKGIDYSDLIKIVCKLKKTSFAHLFAFNLQDKLKTFLENEGLYDDDCKKFVENIDLALSGNWKALKAKNLSQTVSKMKSAFRDVISENAAPHRRIDLIIEEKTLGDFKAAMDESSLAEVEFDRELFDESLRKRRSKSDATYLRNNATAAKTLVKSIVARNSTLVKIANEIAYRQRDFFIGKDSRLVPISRKTLARILFLSESAISRAAAGKSISTPRGIFELKELLPREIKSSLSGVSDYSLRECMKNLIANEPKNDPYSDANIAAFLNAGGISLSRRSVSKYRGDLDIPNVSERAKIYRAAANV